MADPNYGIGRDLKEQAKKLLKLAAEAEGNENLLEALTTQDHIATRLAAEARVSALEAEIAELKASNEDLRRRTDGQAQQLRDIRVALNGAGRNPISEHAHRVFQALADADPRHHLVARVPGDAPQATTLSPADARFVYAMLAFTEDRLATNGWTHRSIWGAPIPDSVDDRDDNESA